MLGRGKLCRYELHHPMSLGDALAALFRSKTKKPHAETALLGLEPEQSGGEQAVPARANESREAVEAAGVSCVSN